MCVIHIHYIYDLLENHNLEIILALWKPESIFHSACSLEWSCRRGPIDGSFHSDVMQVPFFLRRPWKWHCCTSSPQLYAVFLLLFLFPSVISVMSPQHPKGYGPWELQKKKKQVDSMKGISGRSWRACVWDTKSQSTHWHVVLYFQLLTVFPITWCCVFHQETHLSSLNAEELASVSVIGRLAELLPHATRDDWWRFFR